MSLINASYFNGGLQIAQLNQKAVTDSLQIFIDRYEPEFLELVLGYNLMQALIDGLAADPIDSKWLFLRDGGGFTGYDGYQHKWVGIASGNSSSPMPQPNAEIVVPVGMYAGTNSLTYAPLAGAQYWVERRGFGTMIVGVDIALSNNNQTWTLLKSGDVFAANEIFIAHVTRYAAGSPAAGIYPSPIAAYVYYHFMRDLQTQSTGVGETKAQSQNAISVSVAQKANDAWNTMSKQLQWLWEYLSINNDNYPGWDYGSHVTYNWNSLGWCFGYGKNFSQMNIIGI